MPTYTSTESPTATQEPPPVQASEAQTGEQRTFPHNGASRFWQMPSAPRLSGPALQRLCERLSRVTAVLTIVTIAVIALGIVFYGLGANSSKWLVSDVKDVARWLASPFDKTFVLHDAKLSVALNWGIAIVVYAILGRLLGRLIQGVPGRVRRPG